MKTLKIKDYTGGAGPSEEQVQHNNKVLAQELNKLGIPFVEDREFLKELTGIEQEPLLKISHPVTTEEIYVGYDRWGFVVDNPNGTEVEHIDQGSLDQTLTAIKGWYY